MSTLITPTVYPQIRAALGVLVDANLVPDPIIAMDLFAGRAQTWIEETDPDWATRTGADRQHLVLAGVLRCAGLLAAAMPNITAETFGAEYSYSGKAPDWEARSAGLLADAETEIQTVLSDADTALTASMPTLFTVARPYTGGGGRGR